MGYGTTETAPFITFANTDEYVGGSCGVSVNHLECKGAQQGSAGIVPGELVCKGICVMQGYYKNQEATYAVIDQERMVSYRRPCHDVARTDISYVKGRSKNMLLGPNGQNMYPEEIEDKLNSMAMVNESIVLQKGDKLVGLVHPDMDEANIAGIHRGRFREHYGTEPQGTERTNTNICQIVAHSLHDQEFEKTAKKSIKRYPYQEAI